MQKLLTIVIPYYKETKEEISPLLSSINNQLGIDFKLIDILLVNDGSNHMYKKDFFKSFHNLEISVLSLKKNVGPGLARQAGLDKTKSKYVMFCDADDILHNVGVIGTLLQEAVLEDTDLLISPWLEENYIEESQAYMYVNHENEMTWMHGKIFKVGFLKKYNIRFHDQLRVHEDSYFLSLVNALASNQRALQKVTSYVWKWRKESITRVNNAVYTFASVPTFIYAIAESIRELERRGQYDILPEKVLQTALYIYFLTHQQMWKEQPKYIEKAEQRFISEFTLFMKYLKNMDKKLFDVVYKNEFIKSGQGAVINETFEQWIERIIKVNT